MDCLDRETGQLRLTVGREEDTTEQLGLHKMSIVRCLFNLMESPGNGCDNIRAIETGRLGQSWQLFFVLLQNGLFALINPPFHSVSSKVNSEMFRCLQCMS